MPNPENPSLPPDDLESRTPDQDYEVFEVESDPNWMDREASYGHESLEDEEVDRYFNLTADTEPIDEDRLQTLFLEIMRSTEHRVATREYDKEASELLKRAPINAETGERDIRIDRNKHDKYWYGSERPGQLDRLANKLATMLHENPAYADRFSSTIAVKEAHAYGTPETATADATEGSYQVAARAWSKHAEASRKATEVANESLPDRIKDHLERPVKPLTPENGASPTTWANYRRKMVAYERAEETYQRNSKRFNNPTHVINERLNEAKPERWIDKVSVNTDKAVFGPLSKVFGRSQRRDNKLRNERGIAAENNNIIDSHPIRQSVAERTEFTAGADAKNRQVISDTERMHIESLSAILDKARQIASDPDYVKAIPDSDGENFQNMESRHDSHIARLTRVFDESYLAPVPTGENPLESMYPSDERVASEREMVKSRQFIKRINRGLELISDTDPQYEGLKNLKSNALANYVSLSYRHEQLRIGAAGMLAEDGTYNAQTRTSINARHEDNQRIRIFDGKNSKTIYADGSFAYQDEGSPFSYRMNTDGSLWRPQLGPENNSNLDETDFDNLDTKALELRQSIALNAWFQNQDPQLAKEAYVRTLNLAERYENTDEVYDSGFLKARVNQLGYWSAYLYAAANPDEDVRIQYDGSVEELEENHGVEGYWTLRPDGSSFMRERNSAGEWSVTRRHDRFGAKIPMTRR